ncbi:MAG: hypothetical protein JWM07_135 [Candidatus Saccharibacteria bacterium]|nr:hypothetical protein [Candidatus Saccharibacteria bacterium]
MNPIIDANSVNAILTDQGIRRSFIRAAHKAFHVGEYPNGKPLHGRNLEEYGIASLLMWPLNTEEPHAQSTNLSIRLIRARLNKPVGDIHFLRYIRLTPIAGSTTVGREENDSQITKLTFALKEGTLYFMTHERVNKEYAIKGEIKVDVDLKTGRLWFT